MNKYEERYSSALADMTGMKSVFHRSSKEYKDVYEALRQVVALQDQDFSAISPQMLAAQEMLNKSCETYLKSHEGERKTDRGKERFNMIQDLQGVNLERNSEASNKAQEIYGRDPVMWGKIAPIRFFDKPGSEKKGVNFAHAHEVNLENSKEIQLEDDPEFKEIVEKSKNFTPKPDWNAVKGDTARRYRDQYEKMSKAAPQNPSADYKNVVSSLGKMVYITGSNADMQSPEVASVHQELTKACARYELNSNAKQIPGDSKKAMNLVKDLNDLNKEVKGYIEGKAPLNNVVGRKEIPLTKLSGREFKAVKKNFDKENPEMGKKGVSKKQEAAAKKKEEAAKKKAESKKKQEPKKKEEKKAPGMSR